MSYFLHTHHYSRQIMQIIYNDAQDKLFNLKNKMKYFSQIEVSPLQSPGVRLTGEGLSDDVYHDLNCCGASQHYEYATGTLVPGLETL